MAFLGVLCAVQLILIGILLIELRKRASTREAAIRETAGREKTERALDESRFFIERIAETMPNILFIYDLIERRNVYVNKRSDAVIGYSAEEVLRMGDTFLTGLMHPDDLATLPRLQQAYREMPEGFVFENIFRFKHKDGGWRWVQRCATVFKRAGDGTPQQIIGTVTDITDLKRAQEELQQLSARLLTIQDIERRRIAQDLHDSTGQNLLMATIILTRLRNSKTTDDNVKHALQECQSLCEAGLQEIRTLSYLLHPPMLELAGLATALEWYIDGLAKRTGIDIQFRAPSEMERWPLDVETNLFRIAQEGLGNIVRHSGSDRAIVQLETEAHQAVLRIIDFGHGMLRVPDPEHADEAWLGVGIPGMRERLRKIGGSLEILSGGQGTTIVARVPLPPLVAVAKPN